jgi:hypothetical protein
MKEKDSIIDCPQQQVILYVEKEDGKYEPIQTGSYLTKNFLDDYKLKRFHLEETLKKQVQSGAISPIYYYMVLEDLTISELSSRTGIRKGKVKKHLAADNFTSIPQKTLQLYSDVFNITIPDMLILLHTKTNILKLSPDEHDTI